MHEQSIAIRDSPRAVEFFTEDVSSYHCGMLYASAFMWRLLRKIGRAICFAFARMEMIFW